MDLQRAAAESGVKVRFRDPTPVVGTFENISAARSGPGYAKLWDLLGSTCGPWVGKGGGTSGYDDEVRISSPAAASHGNLEIALLSHGQIQQTTHMRYSTRGNYVYLGRRVSFDWLPLGYVWSRFDLAVTGSGGDLVVLSRYEVQGIYIDSRQCGGL